MFVCHLLTYQTEPDCALPHSRNSGLSITFLSIHCPGKIDHQERKPTGNIHSGVASGAARAAIAAPIFSRKRRSAYSENVSILTFRI